MADTKADKTDPQGGGRDLGGGACHSPPPPPSFDIERNASEQSTSSLTSLISNKAVGKSGKSNDTLDNSTADSSHATDNYSEQKDKVDNPISVLSSSATSSSHTSSHRSSISHTSISHFQSPPPPPLLSRSRTLYHSRRSWIIATICYIYPRRLNSC